MTTAALAVAVVILTGGRQLARLAEMRRVKEFVTPDEKVYADTLSLRVFAFFASYPGRAGWISRILPAQQEMLPGSLVLINRPYIAWLDRHGGIWGSSRVRYRSHAFYASPPKSWTPIWTGTTASLFRIDQRIPDSAQ
jgi:hypothetical protein